MSLLKGRKARHTDAIQRVLGSVAVGESVGARLVAGRTGLNPNAVAGAFYALERKGYAVKSRRGRVNEYVLLRVPTMNGEQTSGEDKP